MIFPSQKELANRENHSYRIIGPDGKISGPWWGPVRKLGEGFTPKRHVHGHLLQRDAYWIKSAEYTKGRGTIYTLALVDSLEITFRR